MVMKRTGSENINIDVSNCVRYSVRLREDDGLVLLAVAWDTG